MKKFVSILTILLFFSGLVLSGCLDEKSKFNGTWRYSQGGTVTFNEDNTVNIDNVVPLTDLKLIGIVDYNIANGQITFSSGSIGVTLDYSFPDSNTLILSNDAGMSITLKKV